MRSAPSWPSNVAGLEALVGTVLAGRPLDRIDVGQLPVALRAQAARRPLHGLERAEAQAIIEAMERFGGNKKAAADSLGIARSTLYRKVRALGLDLTARSAQNGQSSVPASIGRGTPVT
jgi:transcriptional regulator of acetoin/glycerol metabolism